MKAEDAWASGRQLWPDFSHMPRTGRNLHKASSHLPSFADVFRDLIQNSFLHKTYIKIETQIKVQKGNNLQKTTK